jgi:hypothetical protein
MTDVSAKLIGIFATNLADMLSAGNGSAPEAEAQLRAPAEPQPVAGPPAPPATGEDSLNLLDVASLPVLKRIAAPAGALVITLIGVLIWRRRRRRG